MGEVYLAQDRKLNLRKVALKVLQKEVAEDQERMRRFLHEAKAASAVNHPNIAHIYEISVGDVPSEYEPVHYIAMEFIDGPSLRQHMNRAKMQLTEVLDISIQIAKAFVAAHAAGIIHRDIKPENVMRCEDGIMKVVDFGLAKYAEPAGTPVDPEKTTLVFDTAPGTLLGTLKYMSPEQARGIGVDRRADIFSLGEVIYELLAGIPPFSGETPADVLAALLNQEPTPLVELAPDTPTELQIIVNKALRKDRDKRYETVKDLLNDLVALDENLNFSARLKRTAHHERSVSLGAQNSLRNRLNETLESAMTECGAISSTFYVRDPFWHDELHLIAMPGVNVKEPMHGFTFPPHSKRVVASGELEIFSADTRFKKELREDAGWSLDLIEPGKRFLFGDFVEREGIKSSARLTFAPNNRVEAVLFVNFAETTTFEDSLKETLRSLLRQCVSDLPALQSEVRADETDDLIQAIRMFPPAYESSSGLHAWEQPKEAYLTDILRVTMEALELKPGTAFGTIHEYDHKTQTLRRVTHFGDIKVERAEEQSVVNGEGIISWVAIRRKALLIRDLKHSKFAEIHVPINLDKSREVQSEVAIPIFAGELLLGVLNLESFLPQAFRPMCVRSLWFAVNRAAVAQKLLRINERIEFLIDRFLDLCHEAVLTGGTTSFSLNRLAELAATELDATRCGIWRYDEIADAFELVGVSPADHRPQPPSSDGMTRFILQMYRIQRLAWPLRIIRENESAEFEIECWNGEDWTQPPSEIRPPKKMNPGVDARVKSLLGIPIKGRLNCVGVAWLEYEEDRERPLVNQLVKLAARFTGYAGLVIEFSHVDLVAQDAVQRIGAQLSEHLLASGPLNFEGFSKIDGYAISQPAPGSRIGGDFHAARVIDEKTAVVLVGDGQGEAITGALNMLPMLTTFEAFWKDSRSATHIMDKIMGISNKLSVKGSAVYCVFKLIGKTLWLSVTAAAHPFLVIVRKVGADPFLYLPQNKDAVAGILGVPSLSGPIVEAHTELNAGDTIIIFTNGLGMGVNDVIRVGLAHTASHPRTVAEAVFARALDGAEPIDADATVLVLRVK
jgi:serine/threonine protein kinase/GAF domain-containing protein